MFRPDPPAPMYARSNTATFGDAVVGGEVVRERQAVHAAADDDHVVARPDLVPAQERPRAEEARHGVVSEASRICRGLHRSSTRSCEEAPHIAGTRRCTRSVGDDHPHRHVCDVSLREALLRKLEPRQVGERPRVASPRSDQTGPAVGGVQTTASGSATWRSPPRGGASAVSTVSGSPTSISLVGGDAVARPGRRHGGVDRAGARHAGDDAGLVRSSSSTKSLPLGVVERRRDDRGARGPRSGGARERPTDGADPAQADPRLQSFRARARRDAPDDPARGLQGRPALRRGVEPQADQLALRAGRPAIRSSAALPEERGLVHRDAPAEAELRGMVVGERVLAQVDVALLQPQDVERVEPVRTDAEISARARSAPATAPPPASAGDAARTRPRRRTRRGSRGTARRRR